MTCVAWGADRKDAVLHSGRFVCSLLIIVYSLLIIVYSLLVILYSLLISVYSISIIVYSLLIIFYSLLIIVHSLLNLFFSIDYFIVYLYFYTQGNSGVRVEERISVPK